MDQKRWESRLSGLSLGLLLLGCHVTSVEPSMSVPPAPAMQQSLPITAQAKIGKTVIQLEVAQTPEQQRIGLMNRTSLASDRGMVFPFNPPRPVQFWMKNTLIPLDMLFVRKGVIKSIAKNVPPCKADPCSTYGSPAENIDQVIELRGGRAAELGLKVGARLPIQFLSPQPQR